VRLSEALEWRPRGVGFTDQGERAWAERAEVRRAPISRRALAHHLAALLVLGVYATKVCPVLDGLPPSALWSALAAVLGLQLMVAARLGCRLPRLAPARHRTTAVFIFELALFSLGGGLMAWFNQAVFGSPYENGLKLLVGFVVLGVFAGLDRALARAGGTGGDGRGGLLPDSLAGRLGIVAAGLLGLAALMIMAVVSRDVGWVAAQAPAIDISAAIRAVALDVGFVLVVFAGHLVNLSRALGRLIGRRIECQAAVLEAVAQGDLELRVAPRGHDELARLGRHIDGMIESVAHRQHELERSQAAIISSLISLASVRDQETGGHLRRTQHYVRLLALELARVPEYASRLDGPTIAMMFRAAPLHDIGKVGIPDSILLKPGPLTPAEFRAMQRHTLLGDRALEATVKEIGANRFLDLARKIVRWHHERWDGRGYPDGLAGPAIPLASRLMAVADTYDALISRRVYKPPMPHAEARAIILGERGRAFDPAVVDAFIAREDAFRAIAERFKDPPPAQRPPQRGCRDPASAKTGAKTGQGDRAPTG